MRPPDSFLGAGTLLVLLVLSGVSAAAEASPPLSLPALIADARERNPTLLAARERVRAMAAVPTQARALDDPTLSYEAWNTPNSFRLDRADNNIFRLSQRLPFPGKRALAAEIAVHSAQESARDAETAELDVVAAVKRAYYELWQTHERLAIFTRDKALVERLTHVVEARYGTGEAPLADVLRAQVELAHLVNRIQTARLAIETARVELAALVSRRADDLAGKPEPPRAPGLDVAADELVTRALAERPDIGARVSAIAREESALQLAHRNQYPDFEVSLSRFVNTDAGDGFGAMVSMTLPVFNAAKYGAAVDEASARLHEAKAELRRVEDTLRREVEQAYLRAQTALLQYELFNATHIPQAEQALRVSESGYQTAAVPFFDLVDTLRSIESVHLEHVSARVDFEKAYADLEQVVGTDLPRPIGKAAATHPSGARE